MHKRASQGALRHPEFAPNKRGASDSRYEVHLYCVRRVCGRERILLTQTGEDREKRARSLFLKDDKRRTSYYVELYKRRSEGLILMESRGDSAIKIRWDKGASEERRMERAIAACQEQAKG